MSSIFCAPDCNLLKSSSLYVLILSVAQLRLGMKERKILNLMQYLLTYHRFHSGFEFQVCNSNQRITLTTDQKLTTLTRFCFDHLLPSVDIFYLMKVDKKSTFLGYLPPFSCRVVCEQPLIFLCTKIQQ